MRQKPSHSEHEHEFLVEHDEDVIVEFDGRYTYASVQCNHAPVLSSATSERHDETFYEHGPRCEVAQYTDVRVSKVTHVETGHEVDREISSVTWERVVHHNYEAIEEEVATSMVGEWGDDESSLTVESPASGDEYCIDLEVDERREER